MSKSTVFLKVLANSQQVTPTMLLHPFAYAPIYDMLLPYEEWLCLVACGYKRMLIQLLSLGVGRNFDPQMNWRTCQKTIQSIARRVTAGLAAAMRHKVAKEAKELYELGQCIDAIVPMQRAIDFGDFTSRALMAWLLIDGREGVSMDVKRAFELAEEGVRLGCHHCKGVMAFCYWGGWGCEEDEVRSLELARESSGKGSRYGQYALGRLYRLGVEGVVAQDRAQAVALYRLAAAQNLDGAQLSLGHMYGEGLCVYKDYDESLRWYQLAAAQGCPTALYNIALCYKSGHGVAVDVAEAIRWYRRAQAAGDFHAAYALQMLSA